MSSAQATLRLRQGLRPFSYLLHPALITALPIGLTPDLWRSLLHSAGSRSWDGSGHYALAQIYVQSIFPDTFGWTHAYFGGMPFPNFYPPLFYWCVGLLSSLGIFSFDTAFKIVLVIPIIVLPLMIWLTARALCGGSRQIASSAALAIIPLLVDQRFHRPSGLDYHSTFVIGLYTQPLGFVLLLAWYITYLRAAERRWRFGLASLLLALTILANFFNAITATVFVAASVASDAVRWYASSADGRDAARRELLVHLGSPLISAGLTLFWTAPLLTEYRYFVTRPLSFSPLADITPAMWIWYVIAEFGVLCWIRRASRARWPFLIACLGLTMLAIFAVTIAPPWFPLQPQRFLATLNFLLAVPVGQALFFVYQRLRDRLKARMTAGQVSFVQTGSRPLQGLAVAIRVAVIGAAFMLLTHGSLYGLTFYSAGENAQVDEILHFARSHTDGRYLVEVPTLESPPIAALDSRAINSYLGVQGNQTLNVIFREASPNAIFLNPLVNVFSAAPDSFGISSMLADDLEFAAQPFARHLQRLRMVGVKYLVISSPWIKERLAREARVHARYDFADWSVFELRTQPMPAISVPAYRPALVVSNCSFKGRRNNEYDFVRLAEEQFAEGWFDVLLVRSPTTKIDQLTDMEPFGALVLETYDCDNERLAFDRLRDFACRRPLILLTSEQPLCRRIRAALEEFPLAEVIERTPEPPGPWMEADVPSSRYDTNSVHKVWQRLRTILEQKRISSQSAGLRLQGEVMQNAITLFPDTPLTYRLPVLITTTYHPNWQRRDGGIVYPATPFFMLTFVNQPCELNYKRSGLERFGLFASLGTLFSLGCLTAWPYRRRFIHSPLSQAKEERLAADNPPL
ncbi:MAG: hypothetical protein V7641_1707 [Blastocatellia bacterium]